MRLNWAADEVDGRLQGIMKAIHAQALDASREYGKPGDYVFGANIAGFFRVAKAMIDQGVV